MLRIPARAPLIDNAGKCKTNTTSLFPGEPLGRITFELYKDVVPRTADNFRQFCTGEYKVNGKAQGYKGSKFHRIVCSVFTPSPRSRTSILRGILEKKGDSY